MAGSQGSDAPLRLLLVEDMPQVAQYIRSLLDAQSKVKLLDVLTDGGAVVDQIRELQPDAAITKDFAKIATKLTSEAPSAKAADRKPSQAQPVASAGR